MRFLTKCRLTGKMQSTECLVDERGLAFSCIYCDSVNPSEKCISCAQDVLAEAKEKLEKQLSEFSDKL